MGKKRRSDTVFVDADGNRSSKRLVEQLHPELAMPVEKPPYVGSPLLPMPRDPEAARRRSEERRQHDEEEDAEAFKSAARKHLADAVEKEEEEDAWQRERAALEERRRQEEEAALLERQKAREARWAAERKEHQRLSGLSPDPEPPAPPPLPTMPPVPFARDSFVKHDAGKLRYGLIPPRALKAVLKVIEFGANRYGVNNWTRADPKERNRFEEGLLRHIYAYQEGEDVDPDSGLPHLAHAACNILFLLGFTEGDSHCMVPEDQ